MILMPSPPPPTPTFQTPEPPLGRQREDRKERQPGPKASPGPVSPSDISFCFPPPRSKFHPSEAHCFHHLKKKSLSLNKTQEKVAFERKHMNDMCWRQCWRPLSRGGRWEPAEPLTDHVTHVSPAQLAAPARGDTGTQPPASRSPHPVRLLWKGQRCLLRVGCSEGRPSAVSGSQAGLETGREDRPGGDPGLRGRPRPAARTGESTSTCGRQDVFGAWGARERAAVRNGAGRRRHQLGPRVRGDPRQGAWKRVPERRGRGRGSWAGAQCGHGVGTGGQGAAISGSTPHRRTGEDPATSLPAPRPLALPRGG
ncbi:uncharacterized protein LOC110259218 [Sus scrofa]|uniref:uncharacterized protein LOC110259218 n=1 Tax=Sus scrofa TaxID=9823 RepID=UPI000A2B4033|nr:uncharacterized protein LOC110259218 [Sus scrofa]